MSSFHIKTASFEGPLDLLLSLIERRKVFINDISLSKIADDFLDRVRSLSQDSLKETADFIFTASVLVLMKSRSLLPGLVLTNEEDENIEELKRRLATYRRVKELALHVRELFGARRIFSKRETRNINPVFSPSRDLRLTTIFLSAQNVIAALPKQDALPQAEVKKIITLEEVMSNLLDRIQRHMKMSFGDFSGSGPRGSERNGESANAAKEARAGVIVSFLALLELMRRGSVSAVQAAHFEDIEIETLEIFVPRY